MSLNMGFIILRGVQSFEDLRGRLLKDFDTCLVDKLRVYYTVYPSKEAAESCFDLEDEEHLAACRFLVRAEANSLRQWNKQISALEAKRFAFLEEHAPWCRVAKTMTCKGCGRVINLAELRALASGSGNNLCAHYCPHCSHSLMSESVSKTLLGYETRLRELYGRKAGALYGVPTGEVAWLVSFGTYN